VLKGYLTASLPQRVRHGSDRSMRALCTTRAGGTSFHSVWDNATNKNIRREYTRSSSAYMLLYEREWAGDEEDWQPGSDFDGGTAADGGCCMRAVLSGDTSYVM
jgi:hypothetical protein